MMGEADRKFFKRIEDGMYGDDKTVSSCRMHVFPKAIKGRRSGNHKSFMHMTYDYLRANKYSAPWPFTASGEVNNRYVKFLKGKQ